MSNGTPPVEWFIEGTIDRRKFDNYLLSPLHPTGKHKARLWQSVFGLGKGDGELLRCLILKQLGQAVPVEKEAVPVETGRTTVQRWELVIPRFRGPNGNESPVLTAWALQSGRNRPHLTTAFPKVNP